MRIHGKTIKVVGVHLQKGKELTFNCGICWNYLIFKELSLFYRTQHQFRSINKVNLLELLDFNWNLFSALFTNGALHLIKTSRERYFQVKECQFIFKHDEKNSSKIKI